MINEENYSKAIGGLFARTALTHKIKPKMLAFAVATLIFLVISISINTEVLRGDARLYWALSADIINAEFPVTIRGYFYPLLLVPGRWLFDTVPALGLMPLKLFQAVVYGYVLTVVLGDIYIRTIGGISSFWRRLTPAVLTAIFFPGLIAFPLSDLPAFLLLISAANLIAITPRKKLTWSFLARFFVAGVLAYASYNTRAIYIFGFAFLSVIILIATCRQYSAPRAVIIWIVFLVGAAAAAIPQMMINTKNFDRATPLVITDTGDKSLFAHQLLWGITTERYETLISPGAKVGTPTYYQDAQGVEIFNKYQLGKAEFNMGTYVAVVSKEPLFFTGLFIRHFINGLDARDGIVYASSISKNKIITSFSCFTILFLSGLVLIYRGKNKGFGSKYSFILMIVIIPPLAITLGAVETRFFYPIHSLAYAAIAFSFERRLVVGLPRWGLVTIFICYIALATVWVTITQRTLQNPIFEFPAAFTGS